MTERSDLYYTYYDIIGDKPALRLRQAVANVALWHAKHGMTRAEIVLTADTGDLADALRERYDEQHTVVVDKRRRGAAMGMREVGDV